MTAAIVAVVLVILSVSLEGGMIKLAQRDTDRDDW